MKSTLIFILAGFLSACSLDLAGFFVSGDIDARFSDRDTHAAVTNISVSDSYYSVVVLTDTHTYGGKQTNLALLSSILQPTDRYILHCGDIVQQGAYEDFSATKAFLDATGLPYYLTLGNHDIYFNGYQNFREVFGRNSYTFVAGDIRIIALDTANGTLGLPQLNWLKEVLSNKTESHCIIFTHFQIFSPHLFETQQYTDIEEIYYLMRLLENHQVDYLLMGHSHLYDYRVVNGVSYLTCPDMNGSRVEKEYIRIWMSNGNLYHTRGTMQP